MIIIVIPCFNEASRLDRERIVSFLASTEEIDLLFIDDGSTDDTVGAIQNIIAHTAGRTSLLQLPQNHGKGEAVRQGVLASLQQPATHLGYWDADLATPLTVIPAFADLLTADKTKKMICGARVQRLGARIRRHWYRHYPGRMIATCISMILGLPIYDSQCGAKLIERDLAGTIFTEPFLSPWLFDVELIARTISLFGRNQASKIIYELPLEEWTDKGDSRINLGYLPKIPFELWRIYTHYRKQLT